MPVNLLRPLLYPALALTGMVVLSLPQTAAEEAQPSPASERRGGGEHRPYLGVIPDRQAAAITPGISVGQVAAASSAAQMGIQPGDRIVAVNGQTVTSPEELRSLLEDMKAGEEVSVRWLRDDETHEQSAPLTSLPVQRIQAQELGAMRANIRRMQAERDALQAGPNDGKKEEADLAKSIDNMMELLNELPKRLDETARAFKQLYPDGTFAIHIDIDIRTNAKDDTPVNLGPGTVTVDPDEEPKDEPSESEPTDPETDGVP
ncbi:MAG: PDZ domain-containing protein [Planctomycetota bacterium]|nr:MAG: PDZ domain-containing protein [Planctomycetota bacterium]